MNIGDIENTNSTSQDRSPLKNKCNGYRVGRTVGID